MLARLERGRDELARKLKIEQDQTEARVQDVLRMERERDEARAEAANDRAVLRHETNQRKQAEAEVARLRSTPPAVCVVDVERVLDEARRKLSHMSAADIEHLRTIIERNTRRVTLSGRTFSEPPAVCVVDVEKVADELCAANYPGGVDSERAAEIIRSHTRSADPEAVAMAIGAVRHPEPSSCSDLDLARAALTQLGVALNEHAMTREEVERVFSTERVAESRRALAAGDWVTPDALAEKPAADPEVERLREERDALRKRVDTLWGVARGWEKMHDEAMREAGRLRAELHAKGGAA